MASSGNVQFQGGLTVYVQAVSNATLTQQVTITPPSGSAAIFSGSGEGNIPMALTTAGFLTPPSNGTWASFTTPGSSNQLNTYNVACQSNKGPSDVESNQTTFQTPAGGNLYFALVVSEDSTDNDYNDSATFFTAWTTP